MRQPKLRQRCIRAVLAIALGGYAFQTGGCQPDVRNAVLTALEDGAQGLVSAVFLSLQDNSADTALTTTS